MQKHIYNGSYDWCCAKNQAKPDICLWNKIQQTFWDVDFDGDYIYKYIYKPSKVWHFSVKQTQAKKQQMNSPIDQFPNTEN